MLSFDNNLLKSAISINGVMSEAEILQWLVIRQESYHYSVKEVPLESLADWYFNAEYGDLVHRSGKFFSIRGVVCNVKGDVDHAWQQPIIDQPEIGVLGFIAKKINGVLHILVQAKMEPGNINMVQLSPTVQATRSNYMMVHGGKRPLYIEYFLGEQKPRVLYDQLQSEQGTRYFKKRNRNLIVEIPEDFELSPNPDFIWMTIGQIQRMTRFDNLVHLDSRSILGGLGFTVDPGYAVCASVSGLGKRILASMVCDPNSGQHTQPEVLSWFAGLKFSIEVSCRFTPLRTVEGWMHKEGRIFHTEERYFSVVGVSVEAENREVSNWMQPLVKSNDGGIIGLICQMRSGILHVLVQGRAEPGLIDIVELAPTVQCTPENYVGYVPSYIDLVRGNAPGRTVVFDSMLSEEGGRFFHSQQRHCIVELDANQILDVEKNYCWMTLRQLQECGRYNNHLNIEMRSLLSCLTPLIDG